MRFLFLVCVLFLFASCATTPPEKTTRPSLSSVSFDDLKGWHEDATATALAAFKNSCKAWGAKPSSSPIGTNGIGGKASDWQNVCATAQNVAPNDDAAARAYFENNFHAFAIASDESLFTGYYVPELHGSRTQEGAFQTPLYAYPADLVSVDLGLFKSELKGQHVIGKVAADKKGRSALVLYDDRAAIAKGSLNGRAQPLVWLDDPVGAFFLEVQGSGRIQLTDGTVLPVGYDGANGHAYVAIGRAMADRGDLPRPVTMPAIKSWLAAHPAQAQDILNINPSYVFFRPMPDDDVIGALGVPLTPQRSMAVDPAFVPLGAPVWLDTVDGYGNSLKRLMVAQDTGGAIKGAVRGDFFWGTGDDAGVQAGAMQSHGHDYILLPKSVGVND